MMRVCADGDVMGEIIKRKYLGNKFRSLCVDDVGAKEEQKIMKYLMERYANMRRTFLLVERQATRTKVSNAVVTGKAVARARLLMDCSG